MTSFLQSFDQSRRRTTKLYFGYGSNLCVSQMVRRCPTAKKLRPLPIYGAKLIFRGVADILITDNPNDVILGGLWRITEEDERALDRYEGVSSGIYKREFFYIRDKSRHWHSVLYYKMASEGIFPPSEGYLYGIVEGYADFGLDLTKLDEAVQHSWDDKNKTEDMRQRYLRNRPTLAHSIEQAKRPMISAPKPKPRRVIEPTSLQARYSTGLPKPGGVPKHQPSWPAIGPHSKLLPKPRSEMAPTKPAPALESLFPRDDDPTTRLSGSDKPLVEYHSREAWMTHASDLGYSIESNGADHYAHNQTNGNCIGYFSDDEKVGFLPNLTPKPDRMPHEEE